MKWGGYTSSALRRWLAVGLVLLCCGLLLHVLLGRPFDFAWLVLTIVAAVVFVVGYYRHQPER